MRPQQQPATRVWITWCDQIGVHPDTIATLGRLSHERHRARAAILPTSRQAPPYIHLDRDANGRITAIRQRREGDEMPSVGESDMGLFSLSPDAYFESASAVRPRGDAGVSDARAKFSAVPAVARPARARRLLTFPSTNELEAIGINTPDDRRRLEAYLRDTGAAVKRLSIVIPAYNEERFIGTLLERIRAVDLTPHGLEKEIIVVDDCSKDGTVGDCQAIPRCRACAGTSATAARAGPCGPGIERATRRLPDDSGCRSRIRAAGLRADGQGAAVEARPMWCTEAATRRGCSAANIRSSRGRHISADGA